MNKLEVDPNIRSSGDGMESSDDEHLHERKKGKDLKVIRKEPKFVPYEPYRAAVTPIAYQRKDKQSKVNFDSVSVKQSKGNSQNLESTEVPKICYGCEQNEKSIMENTALEAEIDDLTKRVACLVKEKQSAESQLDIQTQVNCDLKKLLVASVGEDLGSKVEFLTEDKAHLAKRIIGYSDKVMKDSEKLEKLEVQCDIWRSKFLASSLMVDELARWKATLSHQLQDAHGALRSLLAEQQQLNTLILSTHLILQDVTKHLPPDIEKKPVAREKKTLLNLAYRMKEIAGNLLSYFGKKPSVESANIEPLIPSNGEYHAQLVLSKPDPMTDSHDRCATMFPRFHPDNKFEHITFHCCPHCKGEIVVV